MIQEESYLKVADNTGAKEIKTWWSPPYARPLPAAP